MSAYYNEIDPFAASWLKELIKAGHIAPGIVDERSIEDVVPGDLDGFTQCHFFAGIGVWSYALRQAGWPDHRPVWTGSCPCQPFSTAGKGKGFADERHLWPAFFHLISQRRPVTVFGEQVASKDGLVWLDLVQADMEGAGYTCGAVDTCAAGYGAPHIRQRLYWVADANNAGVMRKPGECQSEGGQAQGEGNAHRLNNEAGHGGIADWLDNASGKGLEGHARNGDGRAQRQEPSQYAAETGDARGLEIAISERRDRRSDGDQAGLRQPLQIEGHLPSCGLADSESGQAGQELREPAIAMRRRPSRLSSGRGVASANSGEADSFWRDADWLFCRDGKWRPVEPGSCPLAHGIAARVGRLRGYGNAIVAPQARAFIRAYLELEAARRGTWQK